MSVGKLNQSWYQINTDSVDALASVNTYLNEIKLDHGETYQYNSALLTILLEHLKDEEPDLYSPAFMRLEAHRKDNRYRS